MTLHRRTHPVEVPGCWACRLGSGPAVAASALPSRKGSVAAKVNEERQLDRDMASYRALRKQGYQPRSVEGSEATERHARTKDEVEQGRPLPGAGNLRPDLLPENN